MTTQHPETTAPHNGVGIHGSAHHQPVAPGVPSEDTIRAWLISQVSQLLGIDAGDIDVGQPLTSYGIDSLSAVTLTGDLELWLGCRLSPTLAWDHPTINALAHELAQCALRSGPVVVFAVKEHPHAEDLAQVMAALEQLSEEEVQATLAGSKQAAPGHPVLG